MHHLAPIANPETPRLARRFDADLIGRLVEDSCRRSGVPMRLTDATALKQIATLLGAASEDPAQSKRRRAAPVIAAMERRAG